MRLAWWWALQGSDKMRTVNAVGDSLMDFEPDLPRALQLAHLRDPLNFATAQNTSPHNILQNATTRLIYDFKYFADMGRPNVVYTLARETHVSGEEQTPSKILHTFTYTDGFGRTIQSKLQAEAGAVPIRDIGGDLVRDLNGTIIREPSPVRWVGAGRTVFDNKGNPVKHYEPFFSSTSDYEDEVELVEFGVAPVLRYDPLGRLIRAENPDGTHVKVDFDAWEQRSFDENDTVSGTPWLATKQSGTSADKRSATLSLAHYDTPTIAHFDTLGRPFLTVANDGFRKLSTRAELDIVGNTLAVIDARNLNTMTQVFDILGRPVLSKRADAGELHDFTNVNNKPARSFTARNHHGTFTRTTNCSDQRTCSCADRTPAALKNL